MKTIITHEYKINYEYELEEFVKKSTDYALSKRSELYNLFNCNENDIGSLTASFFINRVSFVEYIKTLSKGKVPPEWATGCFYGGEIQVLVNVENKESKLKVLTHETIHLFFNKVIYNKYNIDRVNWLDEAFAVYLDGGKDDISNDELIEMISSLDLVYEDFDVNVLSNSNKIITKEYNGYDMFNIIGKYIFENNLEEEYLSLLINDRDEIIKRGKSILKVSIEYFKEKQKKFEK